jgi:hypothetical protein
MTLRPTHPPIQCLAGALSLGVKRPGREADHSPSSSFEVKEYVGLYLHSPNIPSWCGALFKKSTGTILTPPVTFLEKVVLVLNNHTVKALHIFNLDTSRIKFAF